MTTAGNSGAALDARVLVAAETEGVVLRLTRPLSFWGGINPATAEISDPRHPEFATVITDRVLVLTTRGSSSSSAILLELIHANIAPNAIVLTNVDAILALGALAARELGLTPPAICHVEYVSELLQTGRRVAISRRGRIRALDR